MQHFEALKRVWSDGSIQATKNRFQWIANILRDDAARFTPGFMAESWEHRCMRPRFAPNLLKKAVQDLSYLYSYNPVRASESAGEWEKMLWRGSTLSDVLFEADPDIRIGGTCLACILPTPPSKLGGEWDKTLTVSVFPVDRFVAVSDKHDPTKVVACLVMWNTGRPDNDQTITFIAPADAVSRHLNHSEIFASQDAVWYYIDDREIAQVNPNDGKYISTQQHSYGCCPAVTLKNTTSSKSLYGEPWGGPDLVVNNQTVNLFLEELLYTGMLQRGQPVVTRGSKTGQVASGPDVPVEVESAGDFSIIANAANISGMAQALQMALDSWAIGLGISKRAFNVRQSLEATSAEAVYAGQLELSQDRVIREKLGCAWEMAIHRVAQIIARVGGIQLAPLQSVRYIPFQAPRSFGDVTTKARLEGDLSLADKEKISQDLNPTMQPTEIEMRVDSALEERDELFERETARAGHQGITPVSQIGEKNE